MSHTNETIVDRTGKAIAPGQSIRVQQCIGRYGQTQIVEGKIEQMTEYRGVVLLLTKPAVQNLRDHRRHVAAGQRFYVSLPGEFIGKTYVCEHKFEDFEHGHETWAEIIQ